MNSKANPIQLFRLTFAELTTELKNRWGKGAHHSAFIFQEIYKKGNINFSRSPGLKFSGGSYLQLCNDLIINKIAITEIKNEAGVLKFITRLEDGFETESVIVPMATHHTVCVSSQVGCKMGCRFCETARLGFFRNLSVEEIVVQVYMARFNFGADVRNVVFMGMGEPLDNFENVVQAIRVMEDQRGLDISKRYISVSTAGLAGEIKKLADLNWPQLNLAISLNAPNDQIRSRIMPINRIYKMNDLRKILMNFPMKKNGAIYVEYVLIKDLNDQLEHAQQLAWYLKPLRAKVNLIPYNRLKDSPFESPSEEDISRFLNWLVKEKVFVRKRSAKGCNIMAGCGQLGNRQKQF